MAKKNKSPQVSEEQLIDTLRKLEKHGTSALGNISEAALATFVGSAVAGATTLGTPVLFGSTTLGSMAATIGIIGTATPPGLVIAGIGLGAAGLTYGVSKLIRNSGRQDERRSRMAENIKAKLAEKYESVNNAKNDDQVKFVADCLHTAFVQEKITNDFVEDILLKLKRQQITPMFALDIIKEKLDDN